MQELRTPHGCTKYMLRDGKGREYIIRIFKSLDTENAESQETKNEQLKFYV
jgi:hypothetical protein